MALQPSIKPLNAFKLLSFDIYGTLIDWETGIYKAILSAEPFVQLPAKHEFKDRAKLLSIFSKRERRLQLEKPNLEYSDLLAEAFIAICEEIELAKQSPDQLETAARTFGNSVGTWPAFPDTVEALKRLQKRYKLVPLTNSSPKTVGASIEGPFESFRFDALYTAADIGSYKPDLRNFHYLFEHVKDEFGVEQQDILHVAQSLHHDHEPAAKLNLESCWVNRGGLMGNVDPSSTDAKFAWEVKTLGELADMVEQSFANVP